MRLCWLLIFCLLTACTGPKAVPQASPIILLWSEKTIPMSSARAWADEAEKRLHTRDFVLLCVHGGTATFTDASGKKHSEWRVYPDPPRKSIAVDDVAWVLRNVWWDKPLVIISCNEGAFKLTCPRTLYGRRIVWSTPNQATPLWQFRDPSLIGRIEDFTSTEERVKLAGER